MLTSAFLLTVGRRPAVSTTPRTRIALFDLYYLLAKSIGGLKLKKLVTCNGHPDPAERSEAGEGPPSL